MTVLLVGNGGPGQLGGYFRDGLRALGHEVAFVDEAVSFRPAAARLFRRALDRVLVRPAEIRGFNEQVARRARETQPAVLLVVGGRHLKRATLRRVRETTAATLVAFAADNPLVPGRSRANVRACLPEYDVYASPRRSSLGDLRASGCRNPVYVRF